MKLFLLIIYLINLINFSNCSTILFANFYSYPTSDCSGESIGFGYSLKIDECLGAFQPFQQVDDNFWKIEFNKETNSIITTRYSEWNFNCNSSSDTQQFIIQNNQCSIMPNFTVIESGTISGMSDIWYTRASISIGKPEYTPGYLLSVREYYNDNSRGNCDTSNFQTAVTYSQNLKLSIEDTNESETWFCKNNQALENLCDFNGNNCQIFDNTISCNPSKQSGNQNWYCVTP
ncbi:hypothetical protein ACTFIZ_011082 [Dictyostelium cf. discoideum]